MYGAYVPGLRSSSWDPNFANLILCGEAFPLQTPDAAGSVLVLWGFLEFLKELWMKNMSQRRGRRDICCPRLVWGSPVGSKPALCGCKWNIVPTSRSRYKESFSTWQQTGDDDWVIFFFPKKMFSRVWLSLWLRFYGGDWCFLCEAELRA